LQAFLAVQIHIAEDAKYPEKDCYAFQMSKYLKKTLDFRVLFTL